MTGNGTKVDYAKAYETFEKILALEVCNSEAWFYLGICNVARKVPKKAYKNAYEKLEEEYGASIENIVADIPFFVYFENPELLKDFVSQDDYEKSCNILDG